MESNQALEAIRALEARIRVGDRAITIPKTVAHARLIWAIAVVTGHQKPSAASVADAFDLAEQFNKHIPGHYR